MNQCLYEIISIDNKDLIKEQLFCLDEDENDEFEDIQYFGGQNIIINSKKKVFVFQNNIITQILPDTIIYLFQYSVYQNEALREQVLDLNGGFYDVTNLPKFNYNFIYNNNNMNDLMMSFIDSSQENDQRIEYFYLIKTKYNQYLEQINKQDNSTFLYLNQFYLTSVNDQDNIFQYFQFQQNTANKLSLSDSQNTTVVLVGFILIFIILTSAFSLLIYRRSKQRKQIQARLEDLIFKQLIQISKKQFDKKYNLDYSDLIGFGSFGQVYKVKNKYKQIVKNPEVLQIMPDSYACKQLHLFLDGQSQLQQISHEIQVLLKLKNYGHVIQLVNYVKDETVAYLVFDLADSTLQQQINNMYTDYQKYQESEIIKFLSQIGKTLATIYTEEGIAHRDIKPSNILIKDGDYYLSDFGSAEKLFESENARSNLVLGTLKWMSPELKDLKKSSVVDFFKSDIFSLGMVLLYMLTLADISQVNCDEFRKNQKLRVMRNQCKNISDKILLLVSKMLEKNPDDRPDAAILLTSIQEIENTHKLNSQVL